MSEYENKKQQAQLAADVHTTEASRLIKEITQLQKQLTVVRGQTVAALDVVAALKAELKNDAC